MPDEKPKKKIGVYVCHCGGNISDVVSIKDVMEGIKGMEGVEIIREEEHMCSENGQKLILDDIKNYGLDGVVVAACSPQFQGQTFRRVLEKAGLNPNMVVMANIREQCAWPHWEDKKSSTKKAIRLTRMAVEQLKNRIPVEKEKVKIGKNVLVIGGGIAGIQASLDLANAGYKVYLVEKKPSIGGHMAQLSRTFPTEDCSSCILSPKMAEVAEHPNIEIMTNSEVIEVSGSIGNFHAKIRKNPRFVDPMKCTACGKCEEVCPIKVPDEFNLGLKKRKAIYLPSPIAVPHAYVIDPEACVRCKMCSRVCDPKAINYEEKEEIVEIKVDTIIVATGFDVFDARLKPQYGYGKYKNVVTSLELERMIVTAAEGRPLRPIGRNIAFIQCVGSRDSQVGNLYCSRICCMYATKLASLLKRGDPSRDVYIFYTDLRAYGKGFEEYYRRAQESGVKFIRGRPGELMENPDNGKIIVRVEDTLTRNIIEKEFDLVVLSVGMVPSEGTKEIARILKLPQSSDGFLKEMHPKFRPVDTNIEGIFIAGTAQGPKDIPDTVVQASAAAARAMAIMNRGEIELSPIKAYVDEEKCDACGLCIDKCPVDAIMMEKKAKIIPAMCKGCGICIASCPKDAIDLKVFSNDEIISAMKAALEDKKEGEVRIIVFADDMCTYTLADGVGTNKLSYPESVHIIRVPSSARVTPKLILKAFELGADAVFLGECEDAVSPFIGTNNAIKENVRKAKEIMKKLGIEEDRVRAESFVTVMYGKFVKIMEEMESLARKYGNIPEEVRRRIREVIGW